MQVAGIVCEYNPFHTGHAWQLAQLRRRGATGIVCAMSGNFTQRGDFAILRKHVRAEAAVRGGADLVLELPLPWATASAEGFARGGVEVLSAAGVVDTLAFGSECEDAGKLIRAAEALSSRFFSETLQGELKKGDSFASARQRALEKLIGEDAAVLLQPNDILGVEYCRTLRGTELSPLALRRVGAAHDGAAANGYAPASRIREMLAAREPCEEYLTVDMLRLYKEELAVGRAPVELSYSERAILARLRSMKEEDFAAYDEGGEGLFHRFYNAVRTSASLTQLLDAVKTKRYAYARLRRMLLSVYLDMQAVDRLERIPYLRVLAMNGRGRELLRQMRTKAKLPILIKPADVRKLSPAARQMMELEARATDLYVLSYPDLMYSAPGSEWRTGPVIL